VGDVPGLALYMWLGRFWHHERRGRPAFLDDAAAIEVLVDGIVECPETLRGFAGIWGKLIECAPDREEELRQAFCRASENAAPQEGWQESFHPLRLRLPTERSVMPHVLAALVRSCESFRTDPNDVSRETGKHVHGLVDDASILKKIAAQADSKPSIKCAAAVLSVLHPESEWTIGDVHQVLVECYSPGIGDWYFKAIRFCIETRGSEPDSQSRLLVGHLLDVARTDYMGRAQLQNLLARWRETSYAPVNKAGVLQEWLEGS